MTLKPVTMLLFGLAAFALALIVFFPLRLALSIAPGNMPVAAAQVHGTIWSGTLRDVSLAGSNFSSIHMRAQPLALLLGGFSAVVSWNEPGAAGQALLQSADGAVRLSDIQGRFLLTDPTMKGDVGITQGDIQLVGGQCKMASGALTADLSGGGQLTGELVCKAGRLAAQVALPGGTPIETPIQFGRRS